MPRISFLMLAATAMILIRPVAAGADNGEPESVGTLAGLSYVEVLVGGAVKGAEVPMIVALHYMSGSPETSIADYAGISEPARLLAPAGTHPFRDGYSWFPEDYYDLGPEARRAITFEVADGIADFLREATAAYPTRGKPLLTGYSQGGDLTHVIALREPDLISAGLPMGGRFPETWVEGADAGNAPPAEIAIFHGAADKVVDVTEALSAADHYIARGAGVKLYTYAGAGHAYPAGMKSDYESVAELIIRSLNR